MTLLKLENIEMTYASTGFSLNIPSLEIEKGAFFGLIGESGCGKTTLLKTIGGLSALHKGHIIMENEDISFLKAEDRNMSMVFQEPLLFPHMTVLDNIAFPLKIRGVSKKIRHDKAKHFLCKVGLEGYEKRFPTQLSGGQKQRVSIARALVHSPKIILMDEPFSALDPELRDEMRRLVKNLQSTLALTIVFVTHQLDEAALLFDKVAMISQGQIIQTGRPSDIYKAPKTIEVAKFFGFKNLFRGSVTDTLFHIENSTVHFHDPLAGAHCLLIPNHAISRTKTSTRHEVLRGQVTEKNFVHGLIHFSIDVQNITLHYFESMNTEEPINPGDQIDLFIHLDKLTYFTD